MGSLAAGVSYDVIAGQPVTIPGAPFGSPQQRPAVVIFNNSPYVLQVSNSSGGGLLQPLSADVFEFPGIAQGIQVTPTAAPLQQNTFTYLGTITAVFYTDIKEVTGAYPLPLTAFPGGSQLLVAPPTISSQLGFGTVYPGQFQLTSPAAQPNQTPSIFVVPPPGAGELIFTGLTISLGTVGATFNVYGLQTGFNYATFATSEGPEANPVVVSLAGSQDTTYILQIENGSSNCFVAWSNLFASPGPPSPTFANLDTGFLNVPLGPPNLILVPPSDAYYLFDADCQANGAGSGSCALYTGSAGTAAEIVALMETTAAIGVDHKTWGAAKRITTGLWATTATAQQAIRVGYGIGP
jgi:hypothetical protein